MLDAKERENIALKKFSLIAPVLNEEKLNQQEYFRKLAAQPIDMPHYGPRRYAVKSFLVVALPLPPARPGGLKAGIPLRPGEKPPGD